MKTCMTLFSVLLLCLAAAAVFVYRNVPSVVCMEQLHVAVRTERDPTTAMRLGMLAWGVNRHIHVAHDPSASILERIVFYPYRRFQMVSYPDEVTGGTYESNWPEELKVCKRVLTNCNCE